MNALHLRFSAALAILCGIGLVGERPLVTAFGATRGVRAQGQTPVFKAAAFHVLVDVIATDKNDTPVTDLTAADFEIRQDRVSQRIADFEHVSIPAIARNITLNAPLPPSPDTFTNAPPARTARAFVFVMWTLSEKNIVPIKRMMVSFINAMQPEDEVAIVHARRSDLSQDFTTDQGKLVQAVNNVSAATGYSPLRDWEFTMRNVLRSLAAVREPRRAIVFVSEGFGELRPDQPVPLEVSQIFQEALRANVPVYTIDPRGLTAPPLGIDGHLEDQLPTGLERIRGSEAAKDGLRIIALNTNGRAFVNNWNVPEAAARLIGDNNSYYLLGFYPDPYEPDGKFHDLSINVKRPGVRLRARAGYTAEPRPDTHANSSRLIDDLGSGTPGGDLQLHATAAPLMPVGKLISTLMTYDVEYPDGTSGADNLDVAWIAIDPDAKVLASGQHAIAVDVAGRSPRVTIHDRVSLPRGQMTIRAVIHSRTAGTKGTIHIPMSVPDLTKGTLAMTPLVISSSPALPSQRIELAKALELSPLMPTTAREFGTSDRLRVFARVFAAKGKVAEVTMTVTSNMGTAQSVILSSAVVAATTDVQNTTGAGDYIGELSLQALAPGRYVLTFSARIASSKDDVVQRATLFEVK